MTPDEKAALRAEILSGPLAAELAPAVAAGDFATIQTALHDKTRGDTLPVEIRIVDLIDKLVELDRLLAIQTAAETARANPQNATAMQLAALRAVASLETYRKYGSKTVDFQKPHQKALFDNLVDAEVRENGLLQPTDHASVLALGFVPACRIEVIWGRGRTARLEDLWEALK